MKKRNWKKYTFEFLSMFIAVISAFALNNWSENRRDRTSEVKILTEIKNGLQKDIEDIQLNMSGHEAGIEACRYLKDLIQNKTVGQDSFLLHYSNLTRDYISIQNTSGYESMKSKGLDIIKNDSLRLKIISFYEYDFSILKKFEESYSEMQFHDSYYPEINGILSANFIFDESDKIEIKLPLKLNSKERAALLSNIWKIKMNRKFILMYYADIEKKTKQIVREIEMEIKR